MPEEQKQINIAQSANPTNGQIKNGQPKATAPEPGLLQKLLSGATSSSPKIGQGLPQQDEVKQNGNVFTKLFNVTNGLQSSSQLPQKLATQPISTLLGPKPRFSSRELSEEDKKSNKIAKGMFYFAVFISLGVYGFFYTQLEPNFTLLSQQVGVNVAARFEQSNGELQKNQTDLNLIRYRLARLLLDEVNNQIAPLQNKKSILVSALATVSEKQNATREFEQLKEEIKKNLKDLQTIFNQPLGIDTFSKQPVTPQEREIFYESLLRSALANETAALSRDASAHRDEIRLIESVLRLITNKGFRDNIRLQDLGKIEDSEFDALLMKIREEGVNELSTIAKISKHRIDWAAVIEDIASVTRKADLYYGQGLFKTVGGFLFSSYRFDARTGRISLSGVTKTSDSKTFSFIAKLVDSIEKSPEFKDIDFRSFAKSREENGDYSSALSLEFTLQSESDPRDDVLPQPQS